MFKRLFLSLSLLFSSAFSAQAVEMLDLPVTLKTTSMTYLYCLTGDNAGVTDLLEQRYRHIGVSHENAALYAQGWVTKGYCAGFLTQFDEIAPRMRAAVTRQLVRSGFTVSEPISGQVTSSASEGGGNNGGSETGGTEGTGGTDGEGGTEGTGGTEGGGDGGGTEGTGGTGGTDGGGDDGGTEGTGGTGGTEGGGDDGGETKGGGKGGWLGNILRDIGEKLGKVLGKGTVTGKYFKYKHTAADGSTTKIRTCDYSASVTVGGTGYSDFDPTPYNPTPGQ